MFSIGYYFCGLFTGNNPIPPTVTQMSTWQFAESPWEPLTLFPWTWEEFCAAWENYWPLFFSWDNFGYYGLWVADTVLLLSRFFLLFVVPLLFVGFALFSRYTSVISDDADVESKQLKGFKAFQFNRLYPLVVNIKGYFGFLLETKIWLYVWGIMWGIYFNLFSIVIAFFAYYFYFVIDFEFTGIYTQLLKLLEDLTPVIRFIPGIIWVIIIYCVYERICRARALEKLYRLESKNEEFVSELGLFTIAYGNMGVGKTRFVTSCAVTCEAWMRKLALKIMLNNDLKFPNFPWPKLQRFIRECMKDRRIIDTRSCKKVIAKMQSYDEYVFREENIRWWRRQCRERGFSKYKYCFDYDLDHYSAIYNNGVQIKTIWEAIEAYAQAFVIYAVHTSLIYANYSIRSDVCVTDYGNLPDYNYDFFDRDPLLRGEYSRFCHILDYDMLRMGRKMWDENPNKEAFGFGIWVMSELDKELKNTPELVGVQREDDECNQKNDMTIPHLKMSRHAVVIDFQEFVKELGDLQRPEDLRGSARQVGELVFIAHKGKKIPALPFYSTFWLVEGVILKLLDKFLDFYLRYSINRADGTLLLYLFKNASAGLHKYCDVINSRFGVETLDLELESGRMEGGSTPAKWYLTAKDADRYSTNCLAAMFDSDTNKVGIMDVQEYRGRMAEEDELDAQHSHFHRERKEAQLLNKSDGIDEKLTELECNILEAYSLIKNTSGRKSKRNEDDE